MTSTKTKKKTSQSIASWFSLPKIEEPQAPVYTVTDKVTPVLLEKTFVNGRGYSSDLGADYATGTTIYTVPTGYYLYLQTLTLTAADTNAVPIGALARIGYSQDDGLMDGFTDASVRYRPFFVTMSFPEPLILDSGRVLKVFSDVGSNNIAGVGTFTGYLVKKQQESA